MNTGMLSAFEIKGLKLMESGVNNEVFIEKAVGMDFKPDCRG